MSSDNDRRYWNRRAEAELARARAARDPAVSRAHYELAHLCLTNVQQEEPAMRPQLSIVAGR